MTNVKDVVRNRIEIEVYWSENVVVSGEVRGYVDEELRLKLFQALRLQEQISMGIVSDEER